jgi:hypothetical protein
MQSRVIDPISQILKGSLPMPCRGRREDVMYTTDILSAGIASRVIDAITRILKGSLPMPCRGRREDVMYTTDILSAGISSLRLKDTCSVLVVDIQ